VINLIPNEEKKKKVKDFYFRLTVVFLIVLGCSIIIASVAILPSYFLSSVKKNLVDVKLEAQKLEMDPLFGQEALAVADDLEKKLKIIEDTKQNRYIISQLVIGRIILKKMPDIKITGIVYENTPKGKTISVNGIAASRERLLLFRKALEDDVAFKEVNLPISNFIKGSNIKFSLNLIPF
jgi:hypothetical protein